MQFWELILMAAALSMDAFAVAICKGLATPKLTWKHMAVVGLWFGGFQALMPVIGYFLGTAFKAYIEAVDHWVAFVLLAVIGLGMIKEALSKSDEPADASLSFKTMLVMALATSIDALAVGVTFAVLEVQVAFAVAVIGVCTFALSALGVKLGNVFGVRYKSKAEFAGGAILLFLGLKLLLSHLGVLG